MDAAPSTPRLSLSRGAAATWSRVVRLVSAGVDHGDVQARVSDSGRLGGGYLMMTAIAAAIAILGLLLSSPAVVIGAMLLSPLMGPILLLGLSFWMVDWASMRRALLSLGAGFGIALLVSILLTALSPLKEPTAEILARSRPTLFDLLVAIFSGIAGGYAVVRHRGETVIGVAIATALMPPLAVVGFGIGTHAWSIAGGALLLFFTNLVAIALAAAAVAAVSGFRPRVELGRRGWLHHLAVVLILAALCVPLTLSLRTIALESRATAATRADVRQMFGPKSRIASLSVHNNRDGVEVDGLVATQAYVDHATERLADELRRSLHAPVKLSLDQVVLADPSMLKAPPAAAPGSPAPDTGRALAAALREAVPFPSVVTSFDPGSGAGLVLLSGRSGLDLAGARALETGLRARPAGANTTVSPPVQPLPPIAIEAGDKNTVVLGDAGLQRWALARWRVGAVTAQVCRGRRRLRDAQVAEAAALAFAPLPLTIAAGSACTAAPSAPGPFLIVAPATPPAPTPAPAPAPEVKAPAAAAPAAATPAT